MNLQQHNAIRWFRQFILSNKLDKLNYKIARKGDNHIGKILLFHYKPKNKNTLPYYDTSPLVLVISRTAVGFNGINLHYLPPVLRMKFVFLLLRLGINKDIVNSSKLKRLSGNIFFRIAVKQYLNTYVLGNMVSVPSKDWQNIAYLDLAQFKKKSKEKVWKDTVNDISKQ
jgi:hypothetical protein